ncbi:MAG: cell division protein FtsL [Clostridiaceae bacterium]|nr:cell division protein FtsL [Clostridiaceae bacterium]
MKEVKYRYNYIYGSAAPKLNEQPKPERQSRQSTGRKTTPAPRVVPKPEAESFPLAQTIICIIMVFAVFSVIIYRYSTITEMNYALSALNKEYEALKDSNRKLQVSIGSRINQENIRRIAEERLNMKMPDSYQKIPVKVPKVNYSTLAVQAQEEKNSPLRTVLMFFGLE